MRKSLAALLVLLGTFLLVLAALMKFYAGNSLLRTPLDVDSVTSLSGTAAINGESEFPVKATSITRADSEKSDGSVIVFENSSCLVKDENDPPNCVSADDPDERLVTASTDKFATDRHTGIAVNDRKYVDADAGEHKGLVNKFPFQTKKQAYAYWDGTAGRAVNVVYKGSERVKGLETYRFQSSVSEEPIELTEGVQGTYTDTKDIWVEPLTGAIVDQKDDQSRVTSDGKPFLDLSLSFTDKEVQESVDAANANVDKLNLVRTTVPLIALVLGIIALLAGVVLARRRA